MEDVNFVRLVKPVAAVIHVAFIVTCRLSLMVKRVVTPSARARALAQAKVWDNQAWSKVAACNRELVCCSIRQLHLAGSNTTPVGLSCMTDMLGLGEFTRGLLSLVIAS